MDFGRGTYAHLYVYVYGDVCVFAYISMYRFYWYLSEFSLRKCNFRWTAMKAILS